MKSPTGLAAIGLVVAGVAGIFWIAFLALFGHQVPDALVALTTAAIGAVGGLLSPSPMQTTPSAGAATVAPTAAAPTVIYIVFMLVLGAIALVGLLGLIWLTDVNAGIQLDLLRATSKVGTSVAQSGSPSAHALSASSSAASNTLQIPGGIVAISSAAVGAISTLFIPSPTAK
jgi:hypothetical protein